MSFPFSSTMRKSHNVMEVGFHCIDIFIGVYLLILKALQKLKNIQFIVDKRDPKSGHLSIKDNKEKYQTITVGNALSAHPVNGHIII